MAAVGPFRIDGEDWETDVAGNITRTRPAIPANVRTPDRSRPERLRDRKQADLTQVLADIADLEAQRDQLQADIANLNSIIANARASLGAL